MKIFLIIIATFTIFSYTSQALAADTSVIEIDISKNANSPSTCTKLLSALSIQKTMNFVFSENFERRENDITVKYKNLFNEDRKLNLEMTKNTDELRILIKKGLFKNLFLNLNYKQKKYCEVSGHLSWKGEENRFSKSILVYIIDHYFDKLMSFINRLT
ncbi:MAG: hypothetical protein H7281_07195 [Bacteriovorax sp.]|nr:hypothetical protein [Bacteriovorax sp.]